MSIQLANILKYFSKLSVGSLQQTLKHFKPQDEAVIKVAERAELTSMMKSLINSQTYSFMQDIDKFNEIFAKGFDCAESDVLKQLEVNGLNKSLEKLSHDALTQVFKLLSLHESVEDGSSGAGSNLSSQEMIGKIEEECFLQGVNKLLIKMCDGGSGVLKSYCQDLKMTYVEGDDAKNADELMKTMFDLEGDQGEEEEEEPETPAPKKPAASSKSKKPAAAPKKPAAKKGAKKAPATKEAEDAEEEEEEEEEKEDAKVEAPKKPVAKSKAKPAAKSNGKPAAKSTPATTEVSGKRTRKPVTKYEDEMESSTTTTTTNSSNGGATKGKGKNAALPSKNKRKAEEPIEEDETDDEDEEETTTTTKKATTTSSGKNPFGGYRDSEGKYVSPPVSKIAKGVTKDQLHDYFNLEPLQEFCKNNDIIYSPYKKSQLVKIIVDFLETGERPLTKKEKLAKKSAIKKQRKADADAKKAAKKEAASTTASS